MNMKRLLTLICVLGAMLWAQSLSAATRSPRIKENFDFDWQFHLGDDSAWEAVDLPHDWSRYLEFNPKGKPTNGYLDGGIGWYRKTFNAPASYKGRRVSLLFNGVYHNATVYLNGEKVFFHQYGYTPFEVDLTEKLLYGKENVVTVQVDHQDQSRWYTGSGIYRHVFLQVTDPVHVLTNGTYITTPEVNAESATVAVETMVKNEGTKDAKIEIRQRIVGPDGKALTLPSQQTQSKAALTVNSIDTIRQEIMVSNPQLWDIDQPNLYQLETTVRVNGKVADIYTTRFGIRTIRFDSSTGFWLNGRRVKLQGMCFHQDAGCMGTAILDRAMKNRLQIVKEFGTNAVRCSHNPPAPEYLDYCDEIGLLVIDEAFDKWVDGYYGKSFNENWQLDLGDMIRRDRNHPSIILWSIGNEIREANMTTDEGVNRAAMLRDFVHQTEPSRLVMLALQPYTQQKFRHVTDVIGYNYTEPDLIADHKAHPEMIPLVSEAYPYYSNRRENESRDYAEINPWNYVMENDYICGSFMWAGADYIGESTLWPSKGWATCPFDMQMKEKPMGGYFRSVWKKEPYLGMYVVDQSLDIDPGKDHWGFPGMKHDWTLPYTDDRIIPIHTPTNCDSVFMTDVRGKLFGPRCPKDYPNGTIVWNMPYRRGTVRVWGYRNGEIVCCDSIETTGLKAVDFTLTQQDEIVYDGEDACYIDLRLVDEEGRLVQVDDRRVTATVTGSGSLVGINSFEMRRSDRFSSNTLPTKFGTCQLVIRSKRTPGPIEVKVEVEGLADKVVKIK